MVSDAEHARKVEAEDNALGGYDGWTMPDGVRAFVRLAWSGAPTSEEAVEAYRRARYARLQERAGRNEARR